MRKQALTRTPDDVTYTITEATTLTITDCPCTVSKPVYVTPVVVCSTWYILPSRQDFFHRAIS